MTSRAELGFLWKFNMAGWDPGEGEVREAAMGHQIEGLIKWA